MLIVSGARRSGTSMWMQVLQAAGLPVIGEAFPLNWKETLGTLNRGGFYESTLRDGINFTSNPHPKSGVYLHPNETSADVIKVFAEGVVHTEFAFLGRVLVSVRPWQAYAASMNRLWAVEDDVFKRTPQRRPPQLHGALEWWRANFGLIRDVAMRGYPVHFQSWPATLRDPATVIASVLDWLCDALPQDTPSLDVAAAVAVVDPKQSTCTQPPEVACDLPESVTTVFDALFRAVDEGQGLSVELVGRMNAAHELVEPLFVQHAEAHARWLQNHPERAGRSVLSLEPDESA
ncbi:MAG: hypothetical protein KUG77_27635 [Nannocystaceae bacterium]|nr:hypothetical protein [Nannocystaceae bacterium]